MHSQYIIGPLKFLLKGVMQTCLHNHFIYENNEVFMHFLSSGTAAPSP